MRQEGHDQNRDRTPFLLSLPQGCGLCSSVQRSDFAGFFWRMRYYVLLWAARRMRYSITASISSVEALTA